MEGIGHVDDIIAEGLQAVEAKYTADFSKSMYNPDYDAGFPHTEVEDTVDELRIRANRFEKGVIIFTNSEEFAKSYDRLLAACRVTKYRFVIAPAIR